MFVSLGVGGQENIAAAVDYLRERRGAKVGRSPNVFRPLRMLP